MSPRARHPRQSSPDSCNMLLVWHSVHSSAVPAAPRRTVLGEPARVTSSKLSHAESWGFLHDLIKGATVYFYYTYFYFLVVRMGECICEYCECFRSMSLTGRIRRMVCALCYCADLVLRLDPTGGVNSRPTVRRKTLSSHRSCD